MSFCLVPQLSVSVVSVVLHPRRHSQKLDEHSQTTWRRASAWQKSRSEWCFWSCSCIAMYICMFVCIYIYIYICRRLIKIPLTANGHSSRIKTLLSRNFRQLHVCLSRGPCWATTPLMKIRSPPARLRQRITEFLIAFLNIQLASRSPFSGQICWLVFFCKVCWPTHFNMHIDFLPLLRETFAKISLFTDPGHQHTRGLGAWRSQSLTFGNLPAAFGVCFLRLQKPWLDSDSGRCKDVLQDHGVWLSRSLTFGSSAATYEGQSDCPKAPPHRELNQNQTEILRCPSPAGPQAAVGGSPLHNDIMILIPNFRESFAKKNKLLSRNRK